MKDTSGSLAHLSDRDLLTVVTHAAVNERHSTARLIAGLMELDARKLYLGEGYSSLFTYCRDVLHLSEHAAYGRIEAARAARRFPVVLRLLDEGAINLTTVCLLAQHLTPENHVEVLDAARLKSKKDIEHLVARLHPRPDVAPLVRKLPQSRSSVLPTAAAPTQSGNAGTTIAPVLAPPSKQLPQATPLAPERYKIQFTVDRAAYEKLRRAQDLLRHVIPNGDPAIIFDRALTLLVTELEKRKLSQTDRPKAQRATAPSSRHIPAAIRRAVWARDGGRCAFIGTSGRCTETGWLELHHVVPFAAGGKTSIDNLEIRCRAHNAYEAEQYFGSRLPLMRETREMYVADSATRSGPSWSDGQGAVAIGDSS